MIQLSDQCFFFSKWNHQLGLLLATFDSTGSSPFSRAKINLWVCSHRNGRLGPSGRAVVFNDRGPTKRRGHNCHSFEGKRCRNDGLCQEHLVERASYIVTSSFLHFCCWRSWCWNVRWCRRYLNCRLSTRISTAHAKNGYGISHLALTVWWRIVLPSSGYGFCASPEFPIAATSPSSPRVCSATPTWSGELRGGSATVENEIRWSLAMSNRMRHGPAMSLFPSE